MKAGILLALLLALSAVSQTITDTTQQEIKLKKTGQVAVASYTDGKFADAPASIADKLKKVMPHAEVRLLKQDEAQAIWSGDASVLEMAKTLSGTNLVIGLWDSRGKKFFQTVTPGNFGESTGNALGEAWSRQESIVQMLSDADSKTGEERLLKLANAATITGFPLFASNYPDLSMEVVKSSSEALKTAREQLRLALDSNERTDKLNRLHFELSMALRALPPGADLQQRVDAIDKFIQEKNLNLELKQLLAMRKYLVWSGARKYSEAIAVLDEVQAILPDSKLAAKIPGFRDAIRAKMDTPKQMPPLDGDAVPAPVPPVVPPEPR